MEGNKEIERKTQRKRERKKEKGREGGRETTLMHACRFLFLHFLSHSPQLPSCILSQ